MLCFKEILHDVGLLLAPMEVRAHCTFYFHAISGAALSKTQLEIGIEQLIDV